MSKYIHISSVTTTTLASKTDYSVNSATNRRGVDVVKINKISITNFDTTSASVKVFLDGNIKAVRTVNQTTATTNKIIFDRENVISKSDLIEVGDQVWDVASPALHGLVTHLNPDGDNSKEIQISASPEFTNNETINFQKPDHYITGSISIPAGVTLVLDDPFSFNLINHSLKLTNTTAGTAKLTIRID
tara:strand:- start:54 stop:620 length:567 start_codon:yes stop_codon:yes gene_type:complete